MSSIIEYTEYLRPEFLNPNLEVKNISNISISFLERQGIRGLIFDVDNTITKYRGTELDLRIKEHFLRLIEKFNSCIISNTTPERRKALEKYFGLHIVQSTIKKPFSEPYDRALEYLQTLPSETGMIGDRLLTDIAGANKKGIFTIKVKPLKIFSEPLPHTIIRCLETILLRIYQEEGPAQKTYLLPKNYF
ncbi:YqeG family HAD IIIA-type phosphatase [Candidatus Woesearchaeota archaeon]|nr:YqeG family HAD IIIA-type phosphatase [Candidatus Woesearchaeota archaeon]